MKYFLLPTNGLIIVRLASKYSITLTFAYCLMIAMHIIQVADDAGQRGLEVVGQVDHQCFRIQTCVSAQIALKTVQVLGFYNAFQIQTVRAVLLLLHAAALPHGGSQAQFVIGQQHPDGADPVA